MYHRRKDKKLCVGCGQKRTLGGTRRCVRCRKKCAEISARQRARCPKGNCRECFDAQSAKGSFFVSPLCQTVLAWGSFLQACFEHAASSGLATALCQLSSGEATWRLHR